MYTIVLPVQDSENIMPSKLATKADSTMSRLTLIIEQLSPRICVEKKKVIVSLIDQIAISPKQEPVTS